MENREYRSHLKRIKLLEDQIRRLRRFVVGVVVLPVLAIALSAWDWGVKDEVRSKKFVLVDKSGHGRVLVSTQVESRDGRLGEVGWWDEKDISTMKSMSPIMQNIDMSHGGRAALRRAVEETPGEFPRKWIELSQLAAELKWSHSTRPVGALSRGKAFNPSKDGRKIEETYNLVFETVMYVKTDMSLDAMLNILNEHGF